MLTQYVLLLHVTVVTGDKAFDFTTLLHTYFRTPNVEKMTVQGLKGSRYEERVSLCVLAMLL